MSDLTLILDDQHVAMTILDRTGTYDDEWSEFALMRGSDGCLYVGATSGCSCNCFEENLDAEDVVKVPSWQDAARRAQLWVTDGNYREVEATWHSQPYDEDSKRGALDLIARLAESQPGAVTS
jgi:hypothetical protein